MHYPASRSSDHVDTYHGTSIPDPYRWLESPDSDETRAWVAAQNKLTFDYLEAIPARKAIRARLEKLWDYEKFGLPQQLGGRYFYSRNDGLQNQSVLYVTEGLDGEPRELLDPNKLSSDGTVALSGMDVSDDGKLLAYGLSRAGSDWQEWKVRDVATASDRADHLQWIKFSSASWNKDATGLFYSRYDEPTEETKLTAANYFQKLFYHQLGTPQASDRLAYERPDEKEWSFGGAVSEDGRYLAVSVWRDTARKTQLFYLDLAQPDAQMVELITGFDADFDFLGNDGPVFWIKTDWQAPRYRVMAVDLRRPERENWRQVSPESQDVLEAAHVVGERFFAVYMHDAHDRVEVFGLDGQRQRDLGLPGIGTVVGFGGKRTDRETFYAFTSFTTPTTIYRFDVASGESSVFRRPQVDFASEQYETEQVFYTSRDGTRVPMFITHKKGLALDGSNPTVLYGYGGFNHALSPSFSPTVAAWLELGGVYAVPNLRGGGEYGRAWHEAGMIFQKQKVFDDFIAAAQWLIDNRYTSRQKLAIRGGSNGGLLVGACLTQRPELFAAAVPAVGVMDMLRFHKFTIGWAWVSEFGSSDDPEQFKYILGYSPLHNLKPGTDYPATFITTGDHDDRVVPAHSFKFAAALQAAQAGSAPTLIRIETSAGHGAGKPTSKILDEAADVLTFLGENLRMDAASSR